MRPLIHAAYMATAVIVALLLFGAALELSKLSTLGPDLRAATKAIQLLTKVLEK